MYVLCTVGVWRGAGGTDGVHQTLPPSLSRSPNPPSRPRHHARTQVQPSGRGYVLSEFPNLADATELLDKHGLFLNHPLTGT